MAAAQLGLVSHRCIDSHGSDLHGFDHKLTPAAALSPALLLLLLCKRAACYSYCRCGREIRLLSVSFLWPLNAAQGSRRTVHHVGAADIPQISSSRNLNLEAAVWWPARF